MFDNVVRLIGFVRSDAELKPTKTQREYAVLSLATTASWKDKTATATSGVRNGTSSSLYGIKPGCNGSVPGLTKSCAGGSGKKSGHPAAAQAQLSS